MKLLTSYGLVPFLNCLSDLLGNPITMQKIHLLQLDTMQDTNAFVDSMLPSNMSEDFDEAEPDYPVLYNYINGSKCPSQVRKIMATGLHTHSWRISEGTILGQTWGRKTLSLLRI
jgi:hypothetical protein